MDNIKWLKTDYDFNDFVKVEIYKTACTDAEILNEKFNFGLFFNSTEFRTLEYSKLFTKNSFNKTILVDFKDSSGNTTNPDKDEMASVNLTYLNEFSDNHCEKLDFHDIFQYEYNLSEIIKNIPNDAYNVKSKCFIEATGVPLIYTVALLRYLKLCIPSPELYLMNVSGVYEENSNKSYQFSKGLKENIYIPGYYGNPDFSKPCLYIFLLGFEGDRSLSILKANDPDYIEVIIGEPGYQADYSDEALNCNEAFIKETSIFVDKENRNDKIHRIDAGDPAAVCKCILSIYEKHKDRANICLVPLGTKPHAIGAGLAALIKKNISIMYQVPTKYSMNKTKSGEYMWLYKIR